MKKSVLKRGSRCIPTALPSEVAQPQEEPRTQTRITGPVPVIPLNPMNEYEELLHEGGGSTLRLLPGGKLVLSHYLGSNCE